MPAISIKNINKTYIDQDGNEVQALHDINLDVAEGEFVCIVGPSGCGKSTLLEIVAGLLDATSGEAGWTAGTRYQQRYWRGIPGCLPVSLENRTEKCGIGTGDRRSTQGRERRTVKALYLHGQPERF